MTPSLSSADPDLVERWLRARSLARGLPQPVADRGGLRVDTASAEEEARYVFARPHDGLRQLGEEITRPRVFLKLCAPTDVLRAQLPARWTVQSPTSMMVNPGAIPAPPRTPDGFQLDIAISGERTSVRITADDGRLAASGNAAERDGVFVYDRIATDAAFRRKGLGTVLMAALGSTRRSPSSQQILAATDEGRALYLTMGWQHYSPYSTASIPDR